VAEGSAAVRAGVAGTDAGPPGLRSSSAAAAAARTRALAGGVESAAARDVGKREGTAWAAGRAGELCWQGPGQGSRAMGWRLRQREGGTCGT
jgi:hypothetical protein